MRDPLDSPFVMTHFANPDDRQRVTIGSVINGNPEQDAAVHITVPVLDEGVTHHIEQLVLYAGNNIIELHPSRSSSVQRLALGQASSYLKVHGHGDRVTLLQGSHMENVQLNGANGHLDIVGCSSLSNIRFDPESASSYHSISYSSIHGHRDLPVVIRQGRYIWSHNVSLANLVVPDQPIDDLTFDESNIQLKLRNSEGQSIYVQEFSRDSKCWVQLGCWLGSLAEARALIQGPARDWPSFEGAQERAIIRDLPLSAIIDETRDRYRAVLDLIEANHKSVTTGNARD